ncbi:copper chaperone PCu(A)C [Ramlibacter rhizophilus]|uniref:Copper chaperone PCu(A)C n=1 Tax=Ramlibacter rhizophilus TaxID=1781167 RepID=A0A4Z0BET1_9BURK|nr:copper chaperone PCu(A)C [Ramlibacter rhizophilus]TFY97836.1 copper chaperone PCu(A)C [Ramlibacter rhizophilus]
MNTSRQRTLLRGLAFACLPLALATFAQAQASLQVEAPWARLSVPGQQASGAFMRLTAAEPLSLVGARSPVAGRVEVHEMKMDGDVMRMRPLTALPLPAGQAVELRPGGLHLMLLDLKAPLQAGTLVPLTLLLRDARGAEQQLALDVPVSARPPGAAGGARVAPPADAHGGHGHKH